MTEDMYNVYGCFAGQGTCEKNASTHKVYILENAYPLTSCLVILLSHNMTSAACATIGSIFILATAVTLSPLV